MKIRGQHYITSTLRKNCPLIWHHVGSNQSGWPTQMTSLSPCSWLSSAECSEKWCRWQDSNNTLDHPLEHYFCLTIELRIHHHQHQQQNLWQALLLGVVSFTSDARVCGSAQGSQTHHDICRLLISHEQWREKLVVLGRGWEWKTPQCMWGL